MYVNLIFYLSLAENECGYPGEHWCSDKSKCYKSYDKCDDARDCDDGSDEWGCDGDDDSSITVIAVVCGVGIVVTLVATCYGMAKRNDHRLQGGDLDEENTSKELSHLPYHVMNFWTVFFILLILHRVFPTN